MRPGLLIFPDAGASLRRLWLLTASVLALFLATQAPAQTSTVTTPPVAAGAVDPDPRRPAAVNAVAAVGMTVSDMDRAIAFYTEVLPFETVSDVEVTGADYERLQGVFGLRMRVVTLKLGEELLELTEYFAPRGRPIPADSHSQDRWFQHIAIIVSDMDRAYAHLRKHKVQHASTGPQKLPDWNPNAGGIQAFYFRDPDGHTLEILSFPPGKGAAKWHQLAARGAASSTKRGPAAVPARPPGLFLGIDHTAIVVSDTDRSLAFYRDLLGMKVVGESENWGTEQEHLNNVFGARLRITGLTAGHGPAIELLEYLAPRGGRDYPSDSKANDLWHWQTRLVSADAEATAKALFANRVTFVSPGAITLPRADLGFTKGLLVRDPDGHALEVIQR